MSVIHFLNVLEGDCNIIQHDPRNGQKRISVIDVCNADNHIDTEAEKAKKASEGRKQMFERNYVPVDKTDFKQKKIPDNPVDYLKKYGITNIFRFIVTHPDMDHIDGIKDLFDSFTITNIWDTENKKEINDFSGGGYNVEDWNFYKDIRDGKNNNCNRLTYLTGAQARYFDEDCIRILSPDKTLINQANVSGDYNDSSFVLLYTPPKTGVGYWKILFAGDSHDKTWDFILKNEDLSELVRNADVLFAPHHGRDSNRSYEFLKVVKPRLTLFGNASSEHLAYNRYPKIRITNNQAGYVILDISENTIVVYVKNQEFANHYASERDWPLPAKHKAFDAYPLFQLKAR